MKYKISSKAQSDLINIWEYTYNNWSIDQADRYYKLLIDKIKEICQKPDLGRRYDNIRKYYWCVNIKSHIIFYKINDTGEGTVEVIRILHQRMDLLNRIKE